MCSIHIGAQELEVQYKDIIKKPDYFHDKIDFIRYQLSTKAKAWEHEQEVRLLLINPTNVFVPMSLPYKPKDEKKLIDWKEIRAYPPIGGECFDSLYLGIKIDDDEKEKIVKAAYNCNPDTNRSLRLRSPIPISDALPAMSTDCWRTIRSAKARAAS